jgi:thioredoxin 1
MKSNKKITMTFAELTNSDKPVLVDFYADWCAPCRAMKPVLEDLKAQLGEDLSIFKIDVDKNQMIAERYAIRSIPTLILFKNGEPVWRKSGMASSAELQKAVAQF